MTKFVLALTGPAGSGKSTIGEKVAKGSKRCVNIEADQIKHMIVSGFYKDESNPGGWSFNQWALVGDSIGLIADNFLKKGYSVVINGYLDIDAWDNIEKQVEITHKVLLLPKLETVVNRDAARRDDVKMGKEVVTQHHQTFSNDTLYKNFTKVDTTNHTVDETVAAVLKAVD